MTESLKEALRDGDGDQRSPRRKKPVPQSQIEESLRLSHVEPRGPFCPGCGIEQGGVEPEHFWPEVATGRVRSLCDPSGWTTSEFVFHGIKNEHGVFCDRSCVERMEKRRAGEPNWMGCRCVEPCEYCAPGYDRCLKMDQKAKEVAEVAA